MEHSLLHAVQLSGCVVLLGGATFILFFFAPARKTLVGQALPLLVEPLAASVTRWSVRAGAMAAVAGILALLVDVAEVDSRTIFGGVSLEVVWRFATVTAVGHWSLLRLGFMVAATGATRLPGRPKWVLVLLGAIGAALCESFVCHAAAQPQGRSSAIAFEMSHIVAASLWMGVLIHLLLARRILVQASDGASLSLLGKVLRRFSPVALSSAGLLAITGVVLGVRYLVTPGAVVTSAYGLTLLVKVTLLIPLLYAGYVNYRVIRPNLERVRQGDSEASRSELVLRFGRTLELEVTSGILVLIMAGILGSVSPPQGYQTFRLTPEQLAALASPHLPRTAIVDPGTFYGEQERSLQDLQYAEFTHNWSGVMVLLLGCCWLLESLGGRLGYLAERAWPCLLLPFPIFIALAADPEVWLLRRVTFLQTIQDPQLLEHQLGSVLAFIIVAMGWMDRRRPVEQRPLGYLLPVLTVFGSLLLLGHAHSNYTSTQSLTNLINVQHAIFGAFGLFAGVVRWLSLRGLFPERAARLIWPSLIIGLGLFMAFCYREMV